MCCPTHLLTMFKELKNKNKTEGQAAGLSREPILLPVSCCRVTEAVEEKIRRTEV